MFHSMNDSGSGYVTLIILYSCTLSLSIANDTNLPSKARLHNSLSWPLFLPREFFSSNPQMANVLGVSSGLSFRSPMVKALGCGYSWGAQSCRGSTSTPVNTRHTLGIFLVLDLFVEVRFHFPVGGNRCRKRGSRLP